MLNYGHLVQADSLDFIGLYFLILVSTFSNYEIKNDHRRPFVLYQSGLIISAWILRQIIKTFLSK